MEQAGEEDEAQDGVHHGCETRVILKRYRESMSASWTLTCTEHEYIGRAMRYHRSTILCLEAAFGRIVGGFLFDDISRVAVLCDIIRVGFVSLS